MSCKSTCNESRCVMLNAERVNNFSQPYFSAEKISKLIIFPREFD